MPKSVASTHPKELTLSSEPLSEANELLKVDGALESDAMPKKINILPEPTPSPHPKELHLPNELLNKTKQSVQIESDIQPPRMRSLPHQHKETPLVLSAEPIQEKKEFGPMSDNLPEKIKLLPDPLTSEHPKEQVLPKEPILNQIDRYGP